MLNYGDNCIIALPGPNTLIAEYCW